ncbi:hypothetical protein [Mesomycoplasma hyopneumoniae]|uniref:hypothetical protein n=1 Tax=Mesomycoplasma hyopneumoniae TaxID=2099 RepID=UPI0015C5A12D|nr:hypothetical protein [Mesomycoplasma hyopneumoniae]QLG43669.1 hypothetical protein HZK19_03235 [Mesomycoplasma hyopneumoniae]
MNKKSKNLLKKVCKMFSFAAFSTLIITSYSNNNFQDKTPSSQKITENLSKKSQEVNKISQMAAVNELEDEEISKAILEIKPREDEFAPAIPLLFGALGGILFGGVFSSWLGQNPLPELPRLGNVGSYAPQIDQKPSQNTEKKVSKRYENNSYQSSFLDYFQKTEKKSKIENSGPVYGPFLPGEDKRELNPIVAKSANSITIDLNILSIITKTKLSERVAALSRVEFVEITDRKKLKDYKDIHLAYFFDEVPGGKPKFIISKTKISEPVAWELSILGLQIELGIPEILEKNFFPNIRLQPLNLIEKFLKRLMFRPNFYSYSKHKMQQLAYKIAATINTINGANLGYNIPYLNNDNDPNYPKSYYIVEDFYEEIFDKNENWYINMPSSETYYLENPKIDPNRTKNIWKKLEKKSIFFKNYHVRRVKFKPSDREKNEKTGKDIRHSDLKKIEGIHYLYGDPVKFPY